MKLKTFALLTATTLASQAVSAFPSKPNPLADMPFANKTNAGYDLNFSSKNYRTLNAEINGQSITFRAFEKIVYVTHPLEPDYQALNFYVPEAYFNGGEINDFNAQTAPIFLPNSVGGYMPAIAATPTLPEENQAASQAVKNRQKSAKPDAILTALSKGYVVASVGARGRTLGSEGKYTGKAPAVIVDLKAAVRYLHANDSKMPGDANKIISNGTSAGGAMSALLGAAGNSADYDKYLKEAGAAEASDAIFAVSAYCPITNLENADRAYEWEFNGVNHYSRMDMSKLNAHTFNDRSKPMPKIEGTLSAKEIALSNQLKAHFPAYLNSLNLVDENGKKLTLDEKGNGSFKDYMANIIAQSANKARQSGVKLTESWVNISGDKVTSVNWHGYVHSAKRMKSPPAFDALDLSAGENNEFGDEKINNKHFTSFSAAHSSVKEAPVADHAIVKIMNAMNYVENPGAAQHWRIRVGTADRDTSHAISAMLAIKLRMNGKHVDYAIPWGIPHSGDYDLDELFQWTDSITKATK